MDIRKSINGIAIAQKINIKMEFAMTSATSLSVFGMATIVIISDRKADITLIQGMVPKPYAAYDKHVCASYFKQNISKIPFIDHLITKALIILSWSWIENIKKMAKESTIELGMLICP